MYYIYAKLLISLETFYIYTYIYHEYTYTQEKMFERIIWEVRDP